MWARSSRWDAAATGVETGSIRRLVQDGQRRARIDYRDGTDRRHDERPDDEHPPDRRDDEESEG
jgi:hypothetical protein